MRRRAIVLACRPRPSAAILARAAQPRTPMSQITRDPPIPSREHPRVCIASGPDAYANARRALASLDLSGTRGRRVLLKPNIGREADPGSGIVTDAHVVAAAIDVFREAGAEVAVGESPIVGVRMAEAYSRCGLARLAAERECPLLDMDARPPQGIPLPNGRVIRSLKVCADVVEHDCVVSIPVMKTHMHTGVSLGTKNMKGCLWRRSKVDLHMLPPLPGSEEKTLNLAIADMAEVLHPQITLIDGTVGMEGLGPSAGDPRPLGVVLAGTDVLATDAVACHLMGFSPAEIPHLRLAAARGIGTIDLSAIRVDPAGWEALARPFARTPENLAIEFPGVRILDENSCSACQSTLLLFLRRYGDRLGEYFPGRREVCVAIGKGNKTVPLDSLCIGNCTREHREIGIFIPGCPPVPSSIDGAIRESARGTTTPGLDV